MSPKDRSKEPPPPQTAEPSPVAREAANPDTEWPRLLARVVEGIVTAELHEFEDTVLAFLDSAAADAYATIVWLGARIIGAAFLLTGVVLFLGTFLQWWEAFGLVGVIVIAVGALGSVSRRPRRRRSRRSHLAR
jgi:hypothetical protein